MTPSKANIAPIGRDLVRLRLMEEKDLPITLQWRNQDSIRQWFFHPEKITETEHYDWFEGYTARDDDLMFIIEEIKNRNRPVGTGALYHIDWQANRAEFGRLMIGEPGASRKGYAYQAVQIILHIAFLSLDLKEVYLEVFTNNKRAISIYEKIGFKVTGISGRKLSMNILASQPDIQV